MSQIYLFSIPQRSVAHGFCRHVLFCSIMLLFILNHKNMLSISQTADAIIKRLTAKSKAHRDVYLVKKEATESSVTVVLGASCIELCCESLGRLLVKQVQMLNYKCKPDRIGFTIDGRAYGTYCDPGEVLVAIIWNNAK